ncbi:squalene/phytoene synthase family protein [Henriciella litoralis]|uniref:squalene/phytoene synthase family protein n=1 Tax=Henriciella litoralis TaxID=568102 RepID=UPI000A00CF90|nr:squalene/phytoene synthase family protein [Henriciella litoralis]
MGSNIHSSTLTDPEIWANLDDRMRTGDEDRWLSSRYAPLAERRALVALYAFCWELARVRLVVSEPALGAIRFQWWRDALQEIGDGETPRAHDVVGALVDMIAAEAYSLSSLLEIVDAYEDSFETGDRSVEPETQIALLAAGVFGKDHGWTEAITTLAPHVAALRRGETVGLGPQVERAPTVIRPAIAHFRLRRRYADKKMSGPLARRFCVMRAISSGKV